MSILKEEVYQGILKQGLGTVQTSENPWDVHPKLYKGQVGKHSHIRGVGGQLTQVECSVLLAIILAGVHYLVSFLVVRGISQDCLLSKPDMSLIGTITFLLL